MNLAFFFIALSLLFFTAASGAPVVAETRPSEVAGTSGIPSAEMLLRGGLVSASGLIYWGGVLLQARRVRKRIGRTPNLKPRGTKERLLWAGWMIVIVGWIAQPFFIGSESLIAALVHPSALIGGGALIVLGYLATLWCYAAMGAAWRIGIDREGSSSLVQTGPYRRMRHPIYSFQMVMIAGAALLLPTPVSLAILVLHFICASIKASDEEAHLIAVFDGEYRDYMTRSGRFFPRLRMRRIQG
jgi:protein-S-isoprenylcysteine O-methyltransferase Ste14